MTAPHATVVVVTYNSAQVIEGLLESLPSALGNVRADLVVVDNGSTDHTRELVGRHPCRLVTSTNIGYAAAINLGVASAPASEAIVVLNPDTRLCPDSIPRLIAALDRPGAGIAAPRVLDPDGSTSRSLRREPSLPRAMGLNRTRLPLFSEYVFEPDAYENPHPVDWALGAVLAISRRCWDAVGGWDASYFLYSEETDFCLRARDLGFATWYEPTAVCEHIGGGSGQSPRTHAMQVVNRVRLYRRRHSYPGAVLYLLLSVLSEASWIARGSIRSRAAVRALLRPSARPSELGCSSSFIPR